MLREFVTRAEAYGIDYNIIEAIDQPWKTFEGGVGPYWGMFDASRQPKFAWTGPIADPNYWKLAGIALLVGMLLSLPLLTTAQSTAGETLLLAARRQRRRRLVRDRLRLLERPLFRPRRGLRARARARAAGAAGLHRDGAHRGNRRGRVRPQARAADRRRRCPHRTATCRRCRSTSRPIASRRRC